MAKTKISEFNSNPALNTDIDSINLAEGCAPSGINDAIRELMSQLKDWQSGTSNDPMVIGSSGSLTLNQGTANGVAYLNGSKVVTSGSALTFNGSTLAVNAAGESFSIQSSNTSNYFTFKQSGTQVGDIGYDGRDTNALSVWNNINGPMIFGINGSEGMRLTSTGLGIGTSSPSFALDISQVAPRIRQVATTGTNSSLVQLVNTGGTAYFGLDNSSGGLSAAYALNVFHGGAYPIVFSTSGSERMRLDSSGNLGLGVTPSAWSAFKAFEIASVGNSLWSAGSNDLRLATNHVYNGGNKYTVNGYAAQYIQTAGQHQFYTAASGTAGNAITFTQAMTLDASGNLGIGTTTPYSKLDLGSYGSNSQLSWHQDSTTSYGTLAIQNSSAAIGLLSGLKMGSSSNSFASSISSTWAKSAILLDYGNIKFFTDTADTVSYGTTYTPTERARIDSSGNFLIGTSAAGTTAAGSYFEPSSIGYGRINFVKANTGTTYPVAFYYAGSQIGNIANSTTATSYNTSSDYRLKNVIGAVTGHGERIDALEPIEYEWKVDGSRTRGFLAHKFQEVYAGSVTGTKDAVDEQGNPVYQAMQASTSEVIADLVAEIQSLRKRLADAGL